MDMNPDSSPDADEPDALAQRLRDEALAQRPPFSPQLHDRILSHIRDQRRDQRAHMTFRPRQIVRYAAAVAIVAVVLAATWHARPHRRTTPSNMIVKNKIQPIPPTTHVKPSPRSLQFHVAGVVSGDLLPPRIEFQLPSFDLLRPDAGPAADNGAPAGLPEGLLAGLRNPAANAGQTLTEVIPPNFRMLLPLVRPAFDHPANKPVN